MRDNVLGAKQRALAAVITEVADDENDDTAIEAKCELLGSWIRSDRGIPAFERMRVYTNAYFARIESVLREDFGALHASLGDAGFRDLVRLYLMARPPRSYSLGHVGARLPAFLTDPVAEPFQRRFPFAADLAALEWAITDVFDERDAPVLTPATLATLPAEAWARLRFAPVPAHRVLELSWPAQRLRDAWSVGEPLPAISPGATTVLVHRRDEVVFQRATAPDEARALSCMRRGGDFGELCAELAALDPRTDVAPRALALLSRWLGDGLIAAASPQ